MAKFVRIQSNATLEIYPGLLAHDFSNEDAHVADRLQVSGGWVQMRVLIRAGAHLYPACVKDWTIMKNLVRDKVCTVGEETDECTEPEAQEIYDRLISSAEKFREDDKIARAPKRDSEKTAVKRQNETISAILAMKGEKTE